jgi:hypothetical protein
VITINHLRQLIGPQTILCAGFTYLALPNSLETARFLNPSERSLAISRQSHSTNPNKEVDEPFSWPEVRRAFTSPLTYLTSLAYFALLTAIYSIGVFLPTIIVQLGAGYTAHQAQLMTVPPYAVAACTTLAVAFLSDRLQARGPVMLCTMPVAIVGYAVIANSKDSGVKYGMTFLMATGVYSSVPPVLAWLANNSAGHYKRATAAALQLAVANCGGVLSVFLYPDSEAPLFRRSHSVVLGLLVAGWFL